MRRHIDITADLLRYLVEGGQWASETNTACHCHPHYEPSCPECGALKYEDGIHKEGCALYKLMVETKAYLEVENELIEKANEKVEKDYQIQDTVIIPYID